MPNRRRSRPDAADGSGRHGLRRRRRRHGDLPAAVARGLRQERPIPAARLAARRDGRPDARERADSRGDDGHGRRVYGRLAARRCSSRRQRPSTWWPSIGCFTALLAGVIALTQTDLKRVLAYSTISQLGYMFLSLGSGVLAGNHVRHVPSVHACIFQGPAVPRRGQRDARDGGHHRHAAVRRPAADHADHVLDVLDRLPGPGRRLRRSPAFGARMASWPRCTSGPPRPMRTSVLGIAGSHLAGFSSGAVLGGDVHGAVDRVLHLPGVVHHIFRTRANSRRGRPSCPRIGRDG